jgi:hypothetical protein
MLIFVRIPAIPRRGTLHFAIAYFAVSIYLRGLPNRFQEVNLSIRTTEDTNFDWRELRRTKLIGSGLESTLIR